MKLQWTFFMLLPSFSLAFAPTQTKPKSLFNSNIGRPQQQRQKQISSLYMANQFDISRPTFDFLSLRSIRGDALVRYNALNQSEPLRISLYFLLALSFFAAPSLSESVGYDDMSIPATIGSYVLGLSSAGLLGRECKRRSRQLTRIEKELNTELLPIRLPMNALSDDLYTRPTTLKEIQKLSKPPRIIALSGTKEKLDEALLGLSVFGRRLQQATVYVVAIPTDGTSVSELSIMSKPSTRIPWLADSYDQITWQKYFDSLTEDDNDGINKSEQSRASFQWFGLTSGGRSFGSGENDVPLWLQVLGQHLRPADLLDDSDSVYSMSDPVLMERLEYFYSSLTKGDEIGIKDVFSSKESSQVSEVISTGGRIDEWNSCLADGARPEDMLISGADSSIVSDTEAYTTVIEFPANAGIDSATLLALQRWARNSVDEDWKLDLHQTIPWSPDARAQGTLRCDCRGCVALTRGPERRTFGGLIG